MHGYGLECSSEICPVLSYNLYHFSSGKIVIKRNPILNKEEKKNN